MFDTYLGLSSRYRPVQSQKVEKGTDPKSVVCAFFKAGQCTKGDKCKFSHDLGIERKVEKRSLYVDMRDDDENDTMDNWDDGKLREVVDQKHGKEKRMPTTDIVSFALRQQIHLYMWKCDNYNSILYMCIIDLQVLLGCGGEIEIWLVLGVSERRKVYIPSCSALGIHPEAGQEEDG